MSPSSTWYPHHLICSCLGILAAWLLPLRVSFGEDSTRFVILEVRKIDAPALRTRLTDKITGLKAATMDAEFKTKGVSKVADFIRLDPWGKESVEMIGIAGTLDFNGQKQNLEINLEISDTKNDGKLVSETLSSYVALPESSKRSRGHWGLGRAITMSSGSWRETIAWSDEDSCLMIWQYSTVGTPAPAEKTGNARMLEIRWLKAAADDIAQLRKSKPETRDKAVNWLVGRAKSWQEARMLMADGVESNWSTSDEELKLEAGETVAESGGLSIEAKVTTSTSQMELTCKMEANEKGRSNEQVLKRTISAKVTPGVWDFYELEGCKEANVVAYRVEVP